MSDTHHDLHIIGEAMLAGNAAHTLAAAQDRPRRDQTRTGGLMPNAQWNNSTEQASFLVGEWTMMWVLVNFVMFPFLCVYLALSAAPIVAMVLLHGDFWFFAALWAIFCLKLLIKISRGFWNLLYGKKIEPGTQIILDEDRTYPGAASRLQ